MWLYLGHQLVIALTMAISGDARSTMKDQMPPLDEAELDPHLGNGLAECGEDINPSECYYDAFWKCESNSTFRQNCKFSCSPSGQLWSAAKIGDLEDIKTAIAAGANPTCERIFTDEDNWSYQNKTAIHLAAYRNYSGVVLALLDAGVDVNLQTTEGETPTYSASKGGSIEALNVLIEHNADVNIATSNGSTPLMAVVGHYSFSEEERERQLSVAKALIDADASLNVTGGWNNATALDYAIDMYNGEIALHLIKHNAASKTMTQLMLASYFGHLRLAKALINGNVNINETGGLDNATALYYAIMSSSSDIALLLIEHNADVNIAGKDFGTPLIGAAIFGQLSVAKALIDANANLDGTGWWFNATALYYAVDGNHTDIALLLIEQNADVNIASRGGETPLMTAAKAGQLSLAKALIDANANLDVTGGYDNATALHYAQPRYTSDTRDYSDMVLLLLQSGADTMIQDGDGRTPAERARHNEHHHLAEIIESYSTISTNTT